MRNYLRSLNPQLPRSVQILQVGGLLNAIGNGLILPFTLIYLHNERGIGLGTAGLVLGTNAAVSLIAYSDEPAVSPPVAVDLRRTRNSRSRDGSIPPWASSRSRHVASPVRSC